MTMTHDSALNGGTPNRYSGLTLNTYKHEKTAYRQRDKAEELKNVEQARDDEDPGEGQSETGGRGVLAGCCLAALLTVLVVVLCRYLSRQNAKEITDKKSLEESLHYIDLQNDVNYFRIAGIITQETLRVADKQPIGYLARNIASNSDSSHNKTPSTPIKVLDMCPAYPPGLVGPIPDVRLGIDVDIDQIIEAHADIKQGEWKPSDCVSRHRLAIVVPYRDRWSHLKVLLHYLLPILKRQQIHFRVFVVEQHGNQTFNKGRIMNAAYREAMKLFNFHCVIFHDVDLVPEDDRNMYTCAEQPKHMSTAIDKFGYMLPYQGLVGGVLSFRAEHFQTVNGYSNMYWGWGGEDDDMTVRILHRGLRIFRPPSNVARYKMVKHGSRQLSELRLKLLRTAARRSRVEGLNNVPYQLMFTHLEKLFTHFMVDVGKP